MVLMLTLLGSFPCVEKSSHLFILEGTIVLFMESE